MELFKPIITHLVTFQTVLNKCTRAFARGKQWFKAVTLSQGEDGESGTPGDTGPPGRKGNPGVEVCVCLPVYQSVCVVV
jgi:hypothetical protein